MSDKIPKYNSKAECPKCRNADITATHCNDRFCKIYCKGNYKPFHEHFDRVCTHCGYRWVEGCLDDSSRS